MSHFLVTGGAGFIGSHIAERLVKEGHQVRILDNLATGKKENIADFADRVEFIEGDIRDKKICEKACQNIDYVFHEAALGSVPRSIEDPELSNEVNITGTLNILISARDSGVKRLVFASSSSIYGDNPELPKREDFSPMPISPYGLNKYTAETYCSLFYKLYGFETVSLRYFNVFGPRQDPHSQYAAVIPKFITSLIKNEPPVIFGDGNQARDFTYVEDVVEANLLAINASPKICGATYNIAYNQITSLNNLVHMLKELCLRKNDSIASINPIYEEERAGDIRESRANIDLAIKMFDYKPQANIKLGLEKTIEYFSKNSKAL